MSSNIDLSSIVQRLDRIEQKLSRASLLDDLINPVDPPPDDWGRVRPEILGRRLIELIRKFRVPKGDPPPFDTVRFQGNVLEERLGQVLQRNPGWFTDPPPDDFLNVRVLDLIRRYRGGFTDPAPDDLAGVRLRDLIQPIPGGGFTDPPPDDLGRLTRPELEAQLHKINSELVRLKSLERLINDRLSKSTTAV
jgi:hypothetical protein